MTPLDFKNNWTDIDSLLFPQSRISLERFNLLPFTIDFLTAAGLPVYCQPELSFVKETDNSTGITKLTEEFDFETDREEYDHYIVLGSCRDGDIIAIDTLNHDAIVELNHEDSFSPSYFNRSINALAAFLVLYRDFEKEVLSGKDETDRFLVFNFTNEQFASLQQKMAALDKDALTETGFWKDELEIMLSLREEYFGAAS